MKKFILAICFFFSCHVQADNGAPPSTSATGGPQTAPNVVVQVDAQTQTVISKLFDSKASYQNFHRYDKLTLFKIPVLSP